MAELRWSDPFEEDAIETTWPDEAAWAHAWWAEHHESRTSRTYPVSPSATGLMDTLVDNRDVRTVDLIVVLAETAATTDDLGHLGAGVMEDLLTHQSTTEAVLVRAEEWWRRSPRFRAALLSMWVGHPVTPGIRDRLLALGAIDILADPAPGLTGADGGSAAAPGRTARPDRRRIGDSNP